MGRKLSNRRMFLGSVAACAAMFAGATARATVYDATADFSIANGNPNGVWTYGYYNAAGTTFTAYTPATDADTQWHGNTELDAFTQHQYDSSAYSVVGKNVSGSVQRESPNGSIFIDPQTLFTHPGNSGEKGTFRFTAPANGTVDLSVTFRAADNAGGNRDVHVYDNGVSLFEGTVVGSNTSATPASFANTRSVVAGETIDFAVGYGSDGVYFNDATMLNPSVNFTPVPEPAAGVAVAGLLAAGILHRRRAVSAT